MRGNVGKDLKKGLLMSFLLVLDAHNFTNKEDLVLLEHTF